jgi:hypothetical protein
MLSQTAGSPPPMTAGVRGCCFGCRHVRSEGQPPPHLTRPLSLFSAPRGELEQLQTTARVSPSLSNSDAGNLGRRHLCRCCRRRKASVTRRRPTAPSPSTPTPPASTLDVAASRHRFHTRRRRRLGVLIDRMWRIWSVSQAPAPTPRRRHDVAVVTLEPEVSPFSPACPFRSSIAAALPSFVRLRRKTPRIGETLLGSLDPDPAASCRLACMHGQQPQAPRADEAKAMYRGSNRSLPCGCG